MKQGLASVAALLLFASSGNGIVSSKHKRQSSPKPLDVSMVALLANPQAYDGKLVRTIGFLCIEFEGDALYLHEEDYRHALTKNSFALRLTDSHREQFKNSNLKYVLIEGTVYANGLERTDRWSGAIGNITRLEPWFFNRKSTPPK